VRPQSPQIAEMRLVISYAGGMDRPLEARTGSLGSLAGWDAVSTGWVSTSMRSFGSH
jgi:hypothetical protein